jgi:hypothetical protein
MTCIFGDRKVPSDVTKNGFFDKFSIFKVFKFVYINVCDFDIFRTTRERLSGLTRASEHCLHRLSEIQYARHFG